MKPLIKWIGAIGIVYFLVSFTSLFQRKNPLINNGPKFIPMENKVLVSLNYPWKHTGQLYLIDLNGNILSRLTKNDKNNVSPSLSNDGKKIIYSERNPNQEASSTKFKVINLEVLKTELTLDSGFGDYDPSFSSDGTKIIFSRSIQLRQEHMGPAQVWGGRDIFCLDIKTNRISRLTNQEYYMAYNASFIEDDKAVVFVANINQNRNIFKINFKDLKTEKFSPKNINFFKLLPNNKTLFYVQGPLTRFEGSGYQLVKVDIETRKETVLLKTELGRTISSFDVSKDGAKVIFVTETGSDRMNHSTQLFLLDIKKKQIKEIKINLAAPWKKIFELTNLW